MTNTNVLSYIVLAFLLVIVLKIYYDSDAFHLKCIVSEIDGNKYCVRERSKIKQSANLLAKVSNKLQTLVQHLEQKYPDRENVKRLKNGFNPKAIQETLPTSKYTAYSENKGEKMAFCVTDEKNSDNLIDENTLTFVAIHEVAHIMTKSVGHKDEFWYNFKFLIENAKELNLYQPEDYKKSPRKYCGMMITDNPYYDL